MEDRQAVLAGVLAGVPALASFGTSSGADELLNIAVQHGVVTLVAEQLTSSPQFDLPPGVLSKLKETERSQALFSMLLDAETRRLLTVMAQAAIPGLLLKGQAIAQWAYPDPSLRASGDIDVLVATREAADLLARRLCESGYELSQSSSDLVVLEMMLRREVATEVWVEIDLHWGVINSLLFSKRLTFDELMAESIALPRLGANARGLGPAHAFIHACMHWAATLAAGADDRLKWLYDIPAFAKVFTATDWQRLQQLAVARGLAGVCLGMIEASQATFGADFVAVPDELVAALRGAARHESLDATRLRDWRYMEMQAFLAQPSLRLRARYMWQRLFPSRDYMAHFYSRKDLSYLGLIGIRVRMAVRHLLGLKVSDS